MGNNERVVNGVKTRLLHNKDYVEVAERIRIAHAVEDDFEMVEDDVKEIAGRLLWRTVIRVKGKTYMGHAEVKMDAPKNTPDGTNPFECAETSAIGRALAFAGLGTVESIASYDEIARALPVVNVTPTQRQPTVESAPAQRQIPAPVQGNANQLRELITDCLNRAKASGIVKNRDDWNKLKIDAGVGKPDGELLVADVDRIGALLTEREKQPVNV